MMQSNDDQWGPNIKNALVKLEEFSHSFYWYFSIFPTPGKQVFGKELGGGGGATFNIAKKIQW